MSELVAALQQRFGDNRVKELTGVKENYIDLIKIDIQTQFSLRVIMTNGMSDYKMPIPTHLDKIQDKEYTELFICLPEYWDLEDTENPNMNWPFDVIQKLAKNVIENETWYGPGHTIANGNPPEPISSTMKEEYLLLALPIQLEEFFQPLQVGEKLVNFLALVPIFKDEYEHLTARSYRKWIRKFRAKNNNEILDDFRVSMIQNRWRFKR